MIIQSGWAKGLKLQAPKSQQTRPTSAKVRAAIFDVLRHKDPILHMIDLFAGTGAMGLEAISQGIPRVSFVENSPQAIRVLDANLKSMRERASKQERSFEGRAYTADVEAFLNSGRVHEPVDCVWVDPPYAQVLDYFEVVLKFCKNQPVPRVLMMIESASQSAEALKQNAEADQAVLDIRQKKYGDTTITFCTIEPMSDDT